VLKEKGSDMKLLHILTLFRKTAGLIIVFVLLSGCISVSKTDGTQGENRVTDGTGAVKLNTTECYKNRGNHNPLMTQRFGADPWALVYGDTVYVYMTGDVIEKDAGGGIKDNTYGQIHRISIIFSRDLVNWEDCGSVDVRIAGVTSWAHNSWAPAAAAKEIDGKMQFFLYFADSANGIGVLRSDSPSGPFTDPIGKALVDRSVPNCRGVVWMFDPAVLVDNNGIAYLYFGGGVLKGSEVRPCTARVVKLGNDMASLDGEPVTIDAPYMFEDSGINRIGNTYYYSYCTNWSVPESEKQISNGQIAYMTSGSPSGPFISGGIVLPNPGEFFGDWGNNHHCIFQFHGQWYIVYHAQLLSAAMGILHGYRSSNIDKLTVSSDGTLNQVKATRAGVPQVIAVNPYELHSAALISSMAGINTTGADSNSMQYGCGSMAVTDINPGDWIFVEGVDFGSTGASGFTVSVKIRKQHRGCILIYADTFDNPAAGSLDITACSSSGTWQTITAQLQNKLAGKHNLLFVFSGSGFDWRDWRFSE
jgi:arabinoxylan arabinofuranohydrolase